MQEPAEELEGAAVVVLVVSAVGQGAGYPRLGDDDVAIGRAPREHGLRREIPGGGRRHPGEVGKGPPPFPPGHTRLAGTWPGHPGAHRHTSHSHLGHHPQFKISMKAQHYLDDGSHLCIHHEMITFSAALLPWHPEIPAFRVFIRIPPG